MSESKEKQVRKVVKKKATPKSTTAPSPRKRPEFSDDELRFIGVMSGKVGVPPESPAYLAQASVRAKIGVYFRDME